MTTPTTQATDPHAEEPDVPPSSSGSLGDIVRAYIARLRGGDLGSLPAILGLIVLIRTFLSFSLQVEIDGVLPWRRTLASGATTIARATQTARRPGPH